MPDLFEAWKRIAATAIRLTTSVAALAAVLSAPAAGQAPELTGPPSFELPAAEIEDPMAKLSRRIEALEAELDVMRAAMAESAQKPAAPTASNSGAKTGAGAAQGEDEPEWVDVSKEKWTVRLGGHVQNDLVTWANASDSIVGDQNYFEFRRLRLVADGTGYGVFDFRLQMTLEPETVGSTQPPGSVTSPDVKDAYLSMNEIPWLGRFRIGHFFVPFSLEQVTNDTNNIFMERSIPTQGIFAADREVGVAFYNHTPDESITWSYGMFLDSISEGLKESIDDNQGYRLAGRLTWLPYYDEPSDGRYLVHTGVGILHTKDQNEQVRFRARPQIHEGPRLIDSGSLSASGYTTGNIEAAVVWGRLTVQSEAFVSTVHMLTDDNRQLQGAYLHGSWFVTGEHRIFERFGQHGPQFGRNQPFSNFFLVPGGAGPGALELKSRWSWLDLHNLDAGQYNDFTAGFNWYWSDRTRVMFDWIHPFTTTDAVFGAVEADILAMRFDFNW